MNQVSNASVVIGSLPVGKRKGSIQPDGGKQINFRASDELFARLERVANTFGVDMSNLVRLILHQNLKRYEDEAAQLERDQASS